LDDAGRAFLRAPRPRIALAGLRGDALVACRRRDETHRAYQRRVWQALREIPAGTTVTYSEIAKRIGMPRAVRAVASACAANKIAVAIPCHRVVRKDGSLAGYRWGIERKRTLLAREAKQ
jgi:O-6-methylguanine DNA methyltransferase